VRSSPLSAAEWIDVAGAARLLGLTEKAVRARVARRQLPYRRFGYRILFSHQQLTEWLDKLPGVGLSEALANATGERGR
jgi:excisionase family DNA binding protein